MVSDLLLHFELAPFAECETQNDEKKLAEWHNVCQTRTVLAPFKSSDLPSICCGKVMKNQQIYSAAALVKSTVLTIALLIGLLPVSTAQDEMQRLGQVVGAYIGGGYMLTALKTSECGYAYKSTPSGGLARFNEVLSVLKKNPRDIVIKELTSSELNKIEIDAAEFVRSQIKAIKKDYDNKTGCGIVSGMIVSVTQKYDKSWRDYLKSGSILIK